LRTFFRTGYQDLLGGMKSQECSGITVLLINDVSIYFSCKWLRTLRAGQFAGFFQLGKLKMALDIASFNSD
jgi:hypothetical protein